MAQQAASGVKLGDDQDLPEQQQLPQQTENAADMPTSLQSPAPPAILNQEEIRDTEAAQRQLPLQPASLPTAGATLPSPAAKEETQAQAPHQPADGEAAQGRAQAGKVSIVAMVPPQTDQLMAEAAQDEDSTIASQSTRTLDDDDDGDTDSQQAEPANKRAGEEVDSIQNKRPRLGVSGPRRLTQMLRVTRPLEASFPDWQDPSP